MGEIAELAPEQARDLLPAWLTAHVDCPTSEASGRIEQALYRVIETIPGEDLREALRLFGSLGSSYGVQPAHSAARKIGRAFMSAVIRDENVEGAHQLRNVVGRPQLWICNHLSYIDTQITDTLLARHNVPDLDDLLVIAGPKVYNEPFRRFAALAFNTLKTPQSTQLASNEAPLSPREVARHSIEGMQTASRWHGPVLLYPEGTRSPSGQLGSFVRAAGRYTRRPGLTIVPMAVLGTHQFFNRDERMRPGPVSIHIGVPFEAGDAGSAKLAGLEEAWRRVRALLPVGYRPCPDTPPCL